MNLTVIGCQQADIENIEKLFVEAMETAKGLGFNKAIVLLATSDSQEHKSMSFTTNNLRISEIVGILEICKHDIISDTSN